MIPDHVIDEIRARADIVDIIGESVPLKKAGREFKANCPFHEEKTPSFYVVPDKGFYKCFGCGKAGDVFSFVMERQGMVFGDAVKHVAARAGVEVVETGKRRPEDDPNRPLYEITAFAHDWFRGQLADERVGREARAYLEGRGIGPDVQEAFELGFAPDEWRAFRTAAAKHGLDEQRMMDLGLLKQSERSKEPYDGFRGRVIFPIRSISGRVIAFGGRVLESASGTGPKYINSPDSDIYHKKQNLFGISRARNAMRREKLGMIVEGYMDVVSLAAAGFDNVVAPLGTALTPEQAQILSRYTTRILLLFDSDRAGLQATFKSGDILLEAGLHPSVVTFPEGEDPDTYVQEHGADSLQRLLDDHVDVLERKLQILDERAYFSSIDRTRIAVDRLLPTLRATMDPTLRDIYVARVSERTGVAPATLAAEMKRTQESERRSRAVPAPLPEPRAPAGAELYLLKVMWGGVEWVERAAELVSPEDFEDPHNRAIFEALLDDPERRAPPPSMNPIAAQRFNDLVADPEELAHGIEIFSTSIAWIRSGAIQRRMRDLKRRIRAADSEEEKLDLAAELQRLRAEKQELSRTKWDSMQFRDPADHNPNDSSP